MRHHRTVVLAMLTGLLAATPQIGAQNPTPADPQLKVPELNLGQLPKLLNQPLDPARILQSLQKQKPVCSGIIVEADPTIDPEIFIPVPQGPVEYTLRIVEPPCAVATPKLPPVTAPSKR